MKSAEIQGVNGENVRYIYTVQNPWQVWSGSGSANAPTLSFNTIGFDQGAIGTSLLYSYDSTTDTWTATTQTFNGFIGL
jgi:hypothetical protein